MHSSEGEPIEGVTHSEAKEDTHRPRLLPLGFLGVTVATLITASEAIAQPDRPDGDLDQARATPSPAHLVTEGETPGKRYQAFIVLAANNAPVAGSDYKT